ncbi:MAG: hypothetical protein GF416_05640 [Candidatus Altiarchaeales archaeon]|nr:hypothetical protein [Candidatus Altiarchaeales archaeon]MBD3416597.1 hypothetical protein [Candidatus Altiarchaeales archaeon]
MGKWKDAFDLLLRIGFKVGFITAVIGLVMMYYQMLADAFMPFLRYIRLLEAFEANPGWVKISLLGVLVMVAVLFTMVVRGWVEEMADILFDDDDTRAVGVQRLDP